MQSKTVSIPVEPNPTNPSKPLGNSLNPRNSPIKPFPNPNPNSYNPLATPSNPQGSKTNPQSSPVKPLMNHSNAMNQPSSPMKPLNQNASNTYNQNASNTFNQKTSNSYMYPPNPSNPRSNPSTPTKQIERQRDSSTAPLSTAEIPVNPTITPTTPTTTTTTTATTNVDSNQIDASPSFTQSMLDVFSNIEEFDKIEAEAQSVNDVPRAVSTVSTTKPPLQFPGGLPLRNQEAMKMVSMKQGGQDKGYSVTNNQGNPVQNGFAMKRNNAFISLLNELR